MKRLFEQTFTVDISYTMFYAVFMFAAFLTSKMSWMHQADLLQWQANWDSLYNPNFETYPFIQDMNYLGLDFYAVAEGMKPSVWSGSLLLDSLPYAAAGAATYIVMWLVVQHFTDHIERHYKSRVSP